jgi:hypothetical protein
MSGNAAETFDEYLAAAWHEHGEHPQQVADRLAASAHRVEQAGQIPRWAALVTHVFGEHLGQWAAGCAQLDALRSLRAYDGSAALDSALARNIAALRIASGDGNAAADLSDDDRVCALATAASALAGHERYLEAIDLYMQAVQSSAAGLATGSPAIRALAVGGNNLAAALEQKPALNEQEASGMLTAAESALKCWKQCGGWLEEERAEYRLARSQLKSGNAREARAHAERSVAICQRNDAPPFELLFAFAVLASAHRASNDTSDYAIARGRVHDLLNRLDEEQRQMCLAELQDLDLAS